MNIFNGKTVSITLLLLLVFSIVTPLNALAAKTPQYKWTFMVYLDADNNLESAGISDVNEMEIAGSTDEVAIIVLMDRHPGYDVTNGNWTTAKILHVVHDVDMEVMASEELVDLGEVNMGDPQTLVTFVSYVVENFPAEHYALVLWDHGDAWRRSELAGKGVCWDATNNMDYLTELELVQALSQIADMGVHLDIIGFDVCLLQMVEVEFDMMNFADIMVASEEFEPWDGWAYHKFLPQLVTNPDMTAEALASAIVEGYAEYYTQDNPIDWVTLSAIDLVKLSEAISYLDYMAYMLTLNIYLYPENATTVLNLRNKAEKFCEGEFIDVKHFAILVNETTGWPYPANTFADLFIKAFSNATINYFAGPSHPNAYGAAIYFPPNVDWYLEERFWYYEQVAFASYTWWGLFLDYFFRTMTPIKEYSVEVKAPGFIVPGGILSSTILVQFGNKRVDPDLISAYLVLPNGTLISIPVTKLDFGLYVATCQLSQDLEFNTVSVLVETKYWFLRKSSIATVYVSSEIPKLLSSSEEISQEVSTLQMLMEDMNISLEAIKGHLTAIQNDIALGFSLTATHIAEVKDSISNLADQLASVQSTLVDAINSVGNNIISTVSSTGDAIISTVSSSSTAIIDKIDTVSSSLSSTLEGIRRSTDSALAKLDNITLYEYIILVLLIVTLVISVVAAAYAAKKK